MSQPTTVDRHGLLATWENVCLNGHCFLVLGGPSTSRIVPDTSVLQDRGIATFGVNNVAAAIRTNFWTYGDSTKKFHDAIWKDPGIIKFVPFPKMDNPVRTKLPDGVIIDTPLCPRKCPGVVGIARNSNLNPETYLWEETINWGVGGEAVAERLAPWFREHLRIENPTWKQVQQAKQQGKLPIQVYEEADQRHAMPKVLSTMLQAVRLVYFLGFRNCYLLGADFSMQQNRKYLFDEEGNPGTVRGNNNTYPKLNRIWHALRPVFDAANFRVYNVNAESQLTAFDYISFADAYAWAREGIPQVIDTVGWYEKD